MNDHHHQSHQDRRPGPCFPINPTVATINLARKYNVTPLGYVRSNAGNVYSEEERLLQGDKGQVLKSKI